MSPRIGLCPDRRKRSWQAQAMIRTAFRGLDNMAVIGPYRDARQPMQVMSAGSLVACREWSSRSLGGVLGTMSVDALQGSLRDAVGIA